MVRERYIGDIKATGLDNVRLFNLERAPRQTTDLADEQPKRLRNLKQTMLDLYRDVVEEA